MRGALPTPPALACADAALRFRSRTSTPPAPQTKNSTRRDTTTWPFTLHGAGGPRAAARSALRAEVSSLLSTGVTKRGNLGASRVVRDLAVFEREGEARPIDTPRINKKGLEKRAPSPSRSQVRVRHGHHSISGGGRASFWGVRSSRCRIFAWFNVLRTSAETSFFCVDAVTGGKFIADYTSMARCV